MTAPRPSDAAVPGPGAGAVKTPRPAWFQGKLPGLLSIAAGFLLAALVAVQTDADEVAWEWYFPALALSVAGVIMTRRAAQREARHAGSLERDAWILDDSLQRIVRHVNALDQAKNSIPTGEIHRRIDALLRDDLGRFAEARHALTQLHGLAAYAAIMNEFAAGERYLNRVWSASVDGYVDEVREYLTRARSQFESASEKLRALAAAAPRSGHDPAAHRG